LFFKLSSWVSPLLIEFLKFRRKNYSWNWVIQFLNCFDWWNYHGNCVSKFWMGLHWSILDGLVIWCVFWRRWSRTMGMGSGEIRKKRYTKLIEPIIMDHWIKQNWWLRFGVNERILSFFVRNWIVVSPAFMLFYFINMLQYYHDLLNRLNFNFFTFTYLLLLFCCKGKIYLGCVCYMDEKIKHWNELFQEYNNENYIPTNFLESICLPF
jgi:hypothetical protein